jgi:hypothetical protein
MEFKRGDKVQYRRELQTLHHALEMEVLNDFYYLDNTSEDNLYAVVKCSNGIIMEIAQKDLVTSRKQKLKGILNDI